MYYVQLDAFGIASRGRYNNTYLMCDGLSILLFLVAVDSCVNTIQLVCKNVAQLPIVKRFAKFYSPAFNPKVAATLEDRLFFIRAHKCVTWSTSISPWEVGACVLPHYVTVPYRVILECLRCKYHLLIVYLRTI
jgi:hypothetical protein